MPNTTCILFLFIYLFCSPSESISHLQNPFLLGLSVFVCLDYLFCEELSAQYSHKNPFSKTTNSHCPSLLGLSVSLWDFLSSFWAWVSLIGYNFSILVSLHFLNQQDSSDFWKTNTNRVPSVSSWAAQNRFRVTFWRMDQLIVQLFANGYVLESVLFYFLTANAANNETSAASIPAARYPRPEMGLWAHLRASDPFWGRKTPLEGCFLGKWATDVALFAAFT